MSRGLRTSAVAVLLGLLALVPALALTPPAGTGFQPDNLLIGVLAGIGAVRGFRATRGMTGLLALTWRLMAGAGALFSLASLITGSGLAGAFGVAGVGDLLLLVVLCIPPVVCALLANQVRTAGWLTLLVDGATVVLALSVAADVFVLSAPDQVGRVDPLVVGYTGYAVLAVGLAGALCTATTRELQRSSTAVVASAVLAAAAVAMLAVGIDRPGLLWQALGDVACVLCFEAGVLAVLSSPRHLSSPDDVVARSPRVNPAGMSITVLATFGLPAALLVALARGQALTPWSIGAVSAVVLLLLVRSTLRIRTSTRLVADLVRNEEDLRDLVAGSSDGVVVVDDDLRLRFASPAARTLLGLPEGTGGPDRRLPDLVLPEDRDRVAEQLDDATAGTLHLRIPGADRPTELEVTHHERRGEGRRVLHLRDVTVRLRRERELERMAYTDHLTRLPNRALLFQELARPADERCLLVLDLDGFKAVNDVAGHEAGDQLLVEVARRLRNVVRDQDVVCRLGGDEFAVVVDGTPAEAREAAQRVVDIMALPHRTAGFTFAIGASVGVAEVQAGGGQLAFREADTALRAAKQAGKGCVRVWADGTGSSPSGDSVAAALAAGHIELRYSVAGGEGQPERALHGEPFWRHASGDLLPAAELWAAAGRQGQDGALQTWVFAESTRTAADLPGVSLLALDLPAGHVRADQLLDDVRSALAATGFPAERVSLAVTEEAILTAGAELVPVLHELRALGVRICLDDFGMGQTLYAHLARLPLTSVRIDVAALGSGGDTAHALKVVRSIVVSAQTFGLAVVAHGVSPGPLLDDVLACGVHMVRTREDLRHVTAERVREELTTGAEAVRILTR